MKILNTKDIIGVINADLYLITKFHSRPFVKG